MARIVICRDCKQEKSHKARGLCEACYLREYRKRKPPDTVVSLRLELEESYQRVVDAVNDILQPLGGRCYLDGDEVVVRAANREHRREIER